MKSGIEAWLVLSDMQIPYQDDKALAVVEKYMAAHKWDGYINIGDFLDFDSISSFNRGAPRRTRDSFISKDIEIANKILDRHQAIIRKRNPDAKFVLLEGNHEQRVERWLDENPMFEGYFNVENLLRLPERDIKWVRSWSKGEVYKVGHTTFLHGNYTNQYHSAKMAMRYGDNVFYGHTHDVQSHTVASQLNVNKVHVGQSIGCLCIRDLAYMKGQPSNWQQAFMVMFVMPGGNFTYYIPRIFDHKFIAPDGVLYEA